MMTQDPGKTIQQELDDVKTSYGELGIFDQDLVLAILSTMNDRNQQMLNLMMNVLVEIREDVKQLKIAKLPIFEAKAILEPSKLRNLRK